MKSVPLLLSLLALTRAATMLPRMEPSSINVRQEGQQEYMFNENQGAGIEPIEPVVKITRLSEQQSMQPLMVNEQEIRPIEAQISPGQVQAVHLPIATVPAILPAYQYGITHPYVLNNYPYDIIPTI